MRSLLFILMIFAVSCAPKQPQQSIHISLIDNSRSLKIKGFDYLVMKEIGRDSIANIWQGLIPVYRMPADSDMKSYQPIQPGKYVLRDSAVVFTPDTPFVKGREYFVRYYKLEASGLSDYVSGRTRVGKLHFTDLIFKQ
jgi:hypothetical protein